MFTYPSSDDRRRTRIEGGLATPGRGATSATRGSELPARPTLAARRGRWSVLGAFVLALLPGPLDAQVFNYAEGADPTDDPAVTDGVPANLRRYVDAATGDDASEGQSPATAWQSLAAVNRQATTFAPGTYVLFKRGQSFPGTLTLGGCRGKSGARIVFGAYGPGHSNGDGDPFNDLRPHLGADVASADFKPANSATVQIDGRGAQWLMVRDLDTGKIVGSAAASDIVVFNNVAHGNGGASNVIRFSNGTTRCAIVQNLVYDCAANDLITLHSGPATPPASVGSSHWIVDNLIVGNRGAESGIDVAIGGEERKEPVTDDFKIIGNRVQMQAGAIPGLSQRHAGQGTAGIEGGHLGHHLWIMGNMITGAARVGLKHGGLKRYTQVSGNLIWRSGSNSNSVECSTDDTWFEHNTVMHTAPGNRVLLLSSKDTQLGFHYEARRWTVTRNLFLLTHEGSWFESWSTGPDALTLMDWNWYGEAPTGALNGMTLAEWQVATRHDLRSGAGAVPGFSLPPAASNPKAWYAAAFLAHFRPATVWNGNDSGDGTPAGALRSDGSWHGGGPWGAGGWKPEAMRAFPTLAINQGYGWEGPLIVQRRYPLPRPASR